MSRIGKKPIAIPQGVTVAFSDATLAVKGPKGELKRRFESCANFSIDNNTLTVTVKDENDRFQRAYWGLARALAANMVEGVEKGFERKLEIQGVGFKAELKGAKLVLNVGFSHPVEFSAPEGIKIAVDKNVISVSGIDKQVVGETAANIRKIKKPEPYKGKGIRYVGEHVRQKAGKVVKTAAA
jgi:large subunit ribosomal protein L6